MESRIEAIMEAYDCSLEEAWKRNDVIILIETKLTDFD